MWADRNIVQEDGFVALTAPLGKDPAFQQRLATAAVDSVASGANIPDFLTALARPVLDNAAQSLTGLPGYSDAWAETLRKSHRLTFADPSTLPPEADGTSSLTLDVAPLVGLVAKQVSAATTLPLEAPGQVLIQIGQSDQRQLIERVTVYAPMGYAVAVGAGIAFVLAFVAARRRWTVLVGMGAGALVLAGAWKLASDAAGCRRRRDLERQRCGRALQERICRGVLGQLRPVDRCCRRGRCGPAGHGPGCPRCRQPQTGQL